MNFIYFFKKLIFPCFFILIYSCSKNISNDYSSGGGTGTSDNSKKVYMDSINLKTFSSYLNQSYSTVKNNLDAKYIDTSYVQNGNEQFVVFIKDQLIPDRYYSLVIYQNSGTIYAVNVQNVTAITLTDIWDKCFELADSTESLSGKFTDGTLYYNSNAVYSSTSLEIFKSYYYKTNTQVTYSGELLWNNSSQSYEIIVQNNLFYWIAQNGTLQ